MGLVVIRVRHDLTKNYKLLATWHTWLCRRRRDLGKVRSGRCTSPYNLQRMVTTQVATPATVPLGLRDAWQADFINHDTKYSSAQQSFPPPTASTGLTNTPLTTAVLTAANKAFKSFARRNIKHEQRPVKFVPSDGVSIAVHYYQDLPDLGDLLHHVRWAQRLIGTSLLRPLELLPFYGVSARCYAECFLCVRQL